MKLLNRIEVLLTDENGSTLKPSHLNNLPVRVTAIIDHTGALNPYRQRVTMKLINDMVLNLKAVELVHNFILFVNESHRKS